MVLPRFSQIIISHVQRVAAATVPSDLPVGRALPPDQMIVRHCGSKEFPGTVVVADVGQTARLGDSTVGEEVDIADRRTDTKTSHSVASVSVDSFRVAPVIGIESIAVQVPQGTSRIKT